MRNKPPKSLLNNAQAIISEQSYQRPVFEDFLFANKKNSHRMTCIERL
jgi:hypothetical protein